MSSPSRDLVRVLVVDDEPQVAAALAQQLSDGGCQVRIAHGGEEALKTVGAFDPHCVLLDLRMPEPDGIKTAHLLRQRYGGDIVLVGITGWVDDVVRPPELSVLDHCLRKPIEWTTLRRIVRP